MLKKPGIHKLKLTPLSKTKEPAFIILKEKLADHYHVLTVFWQPPLKQSEGVYKFFHTLAKCDFAKCMEIEKFYDSRKEAEQGHEQIVKFIHQLAKEYDALPIPEPR